MPVAVLVFVCVGGVGVEDDDAAMLLLMSLCMIYVS